MYAIRRPGSNPMEFLTFGKPPGTPDGTPEWAHVPRARWFHSFNAAAYVAELAGGEVVDQTLSPVGAVR